MSRYKSNLQSISLLLILTLVVSLASACNSKQEKARKAVEEHLKNQGIREMKVDLFHLADNMPGKAYIAVTVTHNFATSDGSFQKEYLGYILKQDGQNWAVERDTLYTKDKNRAETALAGLK